MKTRTRSRSRKRVIASQKAPSALTLPEGGTRSFTFDLEVQPILDRACIACHNGEGKAFDLRGGKKDKLGYGTSYLNLHPYVHRQGRRRRHGRFAAVRISSQHERIGTLAEERPSQRETDR